jgi:tellurite resistance protein TehA-like permease
MDAATAASILRLLAYMVGLWLWGLSAWFFLVSVGSLIKYMRREHRSKLRFQMTWFSFVFPNTALVSKTTHPSIRPSLHSLPPLPCLRMDILSVESK